MSDPQMIPLDQTRRGARRSGGSGGPQPQGGATPPDAPALRNLAFLATGLTVAAVVLAVPALRDQANAPAPAATAPVTVAQATPAPAVTQTAAATPVQAGPAQAAPVQAAPPPVRRSASAPPVSVPLAPQAPAPAQTQFANAAPLAQPQGVPQPASCAVNSRSLVMPFGQGVVTGIEDPLVSSRRIHGIEVATGGNIDPNYATTLRVVVQPSGGGQSFTPALPPGLVVHVGDRVIVTSGYRNMNLPCNYVPPHVTSDLGPAAPASGTPPTP
jgi:hypothetical protein